MSGLRRVLIDLAVLAGIGFLLALLGPFGSFAAPFPLRLVYWVGLTIAGYAIYRPAMVAANLLAERLDLPRLAVWIAACILATVPMTALVIAAEGLFGAARTPGLEPAFQFYGYVLVIAAALCFVFWLAGDRHERRLAQPPGTPEAEGPAAPPRFLDRLPANAGRELIALEMQDHYVLAHTATGQAMILMRMRDAVAELDGIDGARVHRSWWVARKAVREVKRDGRNVRLVLARGLEVPVARAAVATLQSGGWF